MTTMTFETNTTPTGRTGRRALAGRTAGTFAALVMTGALLGACGDDGGGGDGASTTLAFSFDSLPPLGDGYVYEGWLIVDEAPVTTGRFSIDESGMTTPATFQVPVSDLDGASAFVLTIEPAEGDDPAPADTHILAGDVTGDEIDLEVGHPAAIGTDFADAEGTFILATPTTMAVDDDETQGIWWLVPPATDGAMPTAGLTLPELADGWVYEGWVASGDGPVSTGTFLTAEGADSNGPGDGAGDDPAPPFPGEDFVDPVRDLSAGYMAVISVEPSPDDSPAPFQIKPLAGPIGADTAPDTQTVPNDGGATNPSGAAIFTR